MDQRILKNKDPSLKVGVKYLDERQIENTFPDYPALLERIEDQRQIAAYASSLSGQDADQRQPQMYDNVYAILGGRGTGKSSVLVTLQERLLKESDCQDIVFPIITPEVIIGNNCSIIGWIMSVAEQMVTKIEKRIQETPRDNLRRVSEALDDTKLNFFKDCHFNKNNKLRERYQALMRDCIQDDIPLSSYSFDEMVGLRIHLSHKHYKLIQELNIFWRELADSWQALNKAEKGGSCDGGSVPQPLIILLFDDIDLVPERSVELLSTTFQYFTNPNIVLVLTAAEKMLKRVIWMKMLERLAGSNYNSLLVDFFQKQTVQTLVESDADGERTEGFSLASVGRITMEYYDKVIPPSSRFYLKRFRTISERRNYRYASMEQSFELPEDAKSDPLGIFLIKQVDGLISVFKKDGSASDFKDGLQRKNFLISANKEMRETYLLMFGDKNRNISNGCLGILNCVTRLKRLVGEKQGAQFTEADRGKITNALRHLLQMLLLSKSEVSEFHSLVDQLLYQRVPQQDIYVDYGQVWRVYAQKRDELRKLLQGELKKQFLNESAFRLESYLRDKEEKALGALQQQLAVLFVMLFFIENLLIILEPKYHDKTRPKTLRKLGGSRELASLLNADVFGMQGLDAKAKILGTFKPFPTRQSTEELLDRSPLLLEHIEQYVYFKPFELSQVRLYLMDTFYEVVTVGKRPVIGRLESFLQSVLRNEEDWARSVLKMLSIRYSGIMFIERDFINFSGGDRRRLQQIDIGGWLNEEIRNIFAACMKSGGFLNRDPSHIIEEIVTLGINPQEKTGAGSPPKDLATIMDSLFVFPGQSISEINMQFEENWSKEDMETLLEAFTYETWSFWLYGRYVSDPLPMIVDFVEYNINIAAQFLRHECYLKLNEAQFESIRDLLNDIPEVFEQLRKKATTVKLQLEECKDALVKEGNDLTETIRVPVKMMSDFLCELQDFLFYQDDAEELDDFFSYYRIRMIEDYFELLAYMVPYAPESEQTMSPPSVWRSQGRESAFNTVTVPCNLWFVLMLRMIVKLLPTYFAAKFELKYGNALLDVSPLQAGASSYPQEQAVDEVLKDLYHSLMKNDSSQRLHRLMQDVSTDLTERYISQLGGI